MPRTLLLSVILAFLAARPPMRAQNVGACEAEQALAQSLVAAPGEAERESLLASAVFDARGLARALLAESSGFIKGGKREQAGVAARLGVAVAERAGEPALVARAWGLVGVIDFNGGEYEAALENQLRSLDVAEKAGERTLTARAHTNAGLALGEMGWYDRALAHYQDALALVKELQNREGEAIILNNVGMLHDYRGDALRALEAYSQSVEVPVERRDVLEVGIPLGNAGEALLALGRPEAALTTFERSLHELQKSGARYAMPAAMGKIARAHRARGNEALARDWYGKALAMARTIGNKRVEAHTLTGLADLSANAGDTATAMSGYTEALAMARASRDRRREALVLERIAACRLAQGRPEDAAAAASEAASLAAAIGHPEALATSKTVLGDALLASGRREDARRALDDAIGTIEDWRGRAVAGGEERSRLFEKTATAYQSMVELLLGDGKPEEALGYAERAKARVLVEVLRGGRADVERAMSEAERQEEHALGARLVSLNVQLQRERAKEGPVEARLRDLTERRDGARSAHDSFRARLYAAHPTLRAERGEGPPLTLADTAPLLTRGVALLEYVVGEKSTHLFVVTRDASGMPALATFSVAISRKDLTERVDGFRERLSRRDLDFTREARALYTLLVAPAAPVLRGPRRLVVVPDGPLWELPFQALQPSRGRFLIEESAVSLAPSLTALREMASRARHAGSRGAATRGLLAFANPTLGTARKGSAGVVPFGQDLEPLPDAERQAKALQLLYGRTSRIYIGPEADEKRAKDEMGRHRVLHFATHGLLDDLNPMYSHLVLAASSGGAEDGLLEAREILQMELSAELAVLSACETARGRVAQGEGVIGLSWAFFVAGCPTTVVSQWKVESASTTELMVAFHRGLRAGRAKDEALRDAAVRLLKNPRHRHPFFWAGFVVTGAAG